jgi:UDP-N-acetylmuramoyl-L-alanyl-D-glutamate--2,6-diaminopimelate ligase
LFLQSKLADMVRCGMKACALEVSSHGLAQHRVDGISFDCAIFTNLTYDHLDFHGTMENYFEAKSLLFKNLVKEDAGCVIHKLVG